MLFTWNLCCVVLPLLTFALLHLYLCYVLYICIVHTRLSICVYVQCPSLFLCEYFGYSMLSSLIMFHQHLLVRASQICTWFQLIMVTFSKNLWLIYICIECHTFLYIFHFYFFFFVRSFFKNIRIIMRVSIYKLKHSSMYLYIHICAYVWQRMLIKSNFQVETKNISNSKTNIYRSLI